MVDPVLRAVASATNTAVSNAVTQEAADATAAAQPAAIAAALANVQALFDAVATVLADMLDAITNAIPATTGTVIPGVAGTSKPQLNIGASSRLVIVLRGRQPDGTGAQYLVKIDGIPVFRAQNGRAAVVFAVTRITRDSTLLN